MTSMNFKTLILFFLSFVCSHMLSSQGFADSAWIRINLLGYKPASAKVAVYGSKQKSFLSSFQLIESSTGKTVFGGKASKAYGAYGPFVQTYRLDFSSFAKPGKYHLKAGNTVSPEFSIGEDVYKGAA